MIERAIESARPSDVVDGGAPPPRSRGGASPVEAGAPANPATVRAPWIAQFPVRDRRPGRMYRAWKRFLDLSILTVAAPLWVPVLATSVGLIKLSSPQAPAFFKQQRTGKDGRRFAMYKLRTMVPDAEEQKAKLAHLNELVWPDFKITNDPRVTRLGRFFRKTSLDEIAQVLNVIRGEMSLVGPRPTSFAADTYDVWHTERLDVTPGLTGLWQVAGRTSTLMDDRLRLDLAYLRRESFRLDLEILRRTVFAVLRQEGAS
jgi:lipopolysaccharide/colanic/teichoic acid biosynthesis glycosyltransferase